MDQLILDKRLSDLPLGGIRYYRSINSTNDAAAQWAERGAEDFSLVIADTQTMGRGRSGRKWFSNPGSGLALSLILKPMTNEFNINISQLGRITGLGAIAVCQVIQECYFLPALIKWPNDVLIGNRKCCGILVENHWIGDQLQNIILGIGVNINRDSLPPEDNLQVPATSVEIELSKPVNRLEFLRNLLDKILYWKHRIMEDIFLQIWQSNLAFRGRTVEVFKSSGPMDNATSTVVGKIIGLDEDGALVLRTKRGEESVISHGFVSRDPQRIKARCQYPIWPIGEYKLRPINEEFNE